MGTSAEAIVHAYQTRRNARGPVIERMRLMEAQYDGRIVVPLPEIDKNEKPAVANLLAKGVDQLGMRISSTQPNIYYPPLRPGVKRSEQLARTRRQATYAWWEKNSLDLAAHQRARWLIAYSCAPVMIRPWRDRYGNGCPQWHLRSPLESYPAATLNPLDMEPRDCIFALRRNVGWVTDTFGGDASRLVANLVRMNRTDQIVRRDTPLDVIEYADEHETVMICLGQAAPDNSSVGWGDDGAGQHTTFPLPTGPGREWFVELERVPNRAGVCPVVIPGRVSLGTPKGQFDDLIGLFQMQAKLMALEVIAVEEAIFPNTWFIHDSTGSGKIIDVPHGPSGKIGEATGGRIDTVQLNPGFQTTPIIDRLERAQRIEGGVPAELGGESGSNIRTGRRGEQVLSAVVDFPVQEAQLMLAKSLKHENERAIAIDKAYFGNEKKSFYVTWPGAKGALEYTPNEIFETDWHEVAYPHPGTDQNGLVIGGGQRVGLGTLSKQSFMEIDPLVSDAEREKDKVTIESIETALLSSIQQQAASGEIPPSDVARLLEIIRSDKKELAEAVMQVQKEAQQRQAQQVPQGAPEAMPGIAQPGMGAEMGTIAEPDSDVANMTRQLGLLRLGQRASPEEASFNASAGAA